MDLKLRKYRVYLRKNELADNTIKNYMNTLEQLEQFCKRKGEEELTDELVLDFKEQFIMAKNYTLKTINNKILVVNIYLNWLANFEDSMDVLDFKIKQEKVQHLTHKQYLNLKEFNRVVKYCEDKETLLMIKLIVNTGLRITEACNLTKKDLDSKKISIKNKEKT